MDNNLIEHIYEAVLKNAPYPLATLNKEDINLECELYEELREPLSKEQRDLLASYMRLHDQRFNAEIRETFTLGFKTAIQLIMQTIKD